MEQINDVEDMEAASVKIKKVKVVKGKGKKVANVVKVAKGKFKKDKNASGKSKNKSSTPLSPSDVNTVTSICVKNAKNGVDPNTGEIMHDEDLNVDVDEDVENVEVDVEDAIIAVQYGKGKEQVNEQVKESLTMVRLYS